MITIELRFLTGRYHSTPWGRNVVEGAVEWPPSPYRLLRALVDVWKRKFPHLSEEQVEPVLSRLAATLPIFHLPPASSGHARYFMSANSKDITDRNKIFDAFVVTKPETPVLVRWDSTELCNEEQRILSGLLSSLNYLGRSESWVEARLTGNDSASYSFNCYPEHRKSEDMANSGDTEPVSVACVKSPHSYKADNIAGKNWLDSLCMTSEDVMKERLSGPPAMETVRYFRKQNPFTVDFSYGKPPGSSEVSAVVYAIDSKVMPKVTDGLLVAGRFRELIMGTHKNIMDNDKTRVSRKFSGKNPDGTPLKGHAHSYFLPLDRDRDGKIDHFTVMCNECFDENEMQALNRMNKVFQKGGHDIHLIPIKFCRKDEIFINPSRRFVSCTPFVPPRHYKKTEAIFPNG